MPSERPAGELELRHYLAVLRSRGWIVVLVAAVVTSVAIGWSSTQTKVYRATADVLLQQRVSERLFSPTAADGESVVAVDTEIEVMTSQVVRAAVAEALGWSPNVSVSPRGSTSVVSISVEDPDPVRAATAANQYARTYTEVRRTQVVDDLLTASVEVQRRVDEIDKRLAELDAAEDERDTVERRGLETQRTAYAQQLGQLQLASNLTQTGGAQLMTEAGTPTSPVRPDPKRAGLLGVAAGLLLGLGLAFLVDHLDDRVRTKDDLEDVTRGLPVLGLIPQVSGWRNRKRAVLVSMENAGSPAAESYRTLRTSVRVVGIERTTNVIQVTSANSGEGKTTTLVNLGVAMAKAGQRVVLVCCDLRQPRLHEFFGVKNDVGFMSAYFGERELADSLQAVPWVPNLYLLASGPLPLNPSEVLGSARTQNIVDRLRASADVVLLDSPPVLPVTDALVLAGLADMTLLVAAAGSTRADDTRSALDLLQQVGANVVGTVLNGTRNRTRRYRYRYHYLRHADEQATRTEGKLPVGVGPRG